MSTVYQTSIRFHPQRNQLAISKEGSAMSYSLESHGGKNFQVSVADTVEDPLLRSLNGKSTELSTLQDELHAHVAPQVEKARSASRWSNILGGVGLLAAGACALAGLGTVAAVGAAALGIGAFVVGQKKAQSILAPVRNCIDLGWSLNKMQAAPVQPGLFFSSSAEQHESSPNFLKARPQPPATPAAVA